MAFGEGQLSVSTAPGPAPRRRRPHGLAAVVMAVGIGVTAALALVTIQARDRTDASLLSLQTRLVSAALASSQALYVEDHLGTAAKLAAVTNGNRAVFTRGIADAVRPRGSFGVVALWRLRKSSPRLLAIAGGDKLLEPNADAAAALVVRAAASKTFVVALYSRPHALRLLYADAARGPSGIFVAFAQSTLPANRRTSQPASSPVVQLNFAFYLGHTQTSSALLVADSAAPLPLRGTTYTSRIPFGNTVLTLTTSPRSSLSGVIGQVLPWSIVVGGVLLTTLFALLTERLVRRRDKAEWLSDEVGGLYVDQRSIAETLQHALLPQAKPAIPGMEIAVRYMPGVRDTEIGGDWYDVVPLDDKRFVFVIGDVSGRGIGAAAVMASLHFASRAYAIEGHEPAAILSHLSATLDIGRDGHFATVLCGLVHVDTHEVVLASAGHLPPLLCTSGAASLVSAEPASPIGVAGQTAFRQVTLRTSVNDTLIAYTDGLIERRGESLDAGLRRLRDAASVRSSLEDLVGGIVTQLTADSPNDDIALIGLRWLN